MSKLIGKLTYLGGVALILGLLVLTGTAAMKCTAAGDADDVLRAYLDGDPPPVLAVDLFTVEPLRVESALADDKPWVRKETPLALSTTYRGPPLV
jgi:hypothetical protein